MLKKIINDINFENSEQCKTFNDLIDYFKSELDTIKNKIAEDLEKESTKRTLLNYYQDIYEIEKNIKIACNEYNKILVDFIKDLLENSILD